MRASGVSSVRPRAPCTWIARSITSHERMRGGELEERHLDPCLRPLVDLPRRIHRQEAAGLDLRGGVGNPVLDGLLLGERPAERHALVRVATHELERALHLPEPAHDVVDPPRAESLLREPERLALASERVRDRHANAR